MPINLINDAWIPIRRASGERAKVRPADIAATPGPDAPMELDAARPDYDGALIQILVGMFQCFLPPVDEDGWWRWLETPPTPDAVHDVLARWAFAFDLVGERAFLQDSEDLPEKFRSQINALHLTSPGAQTLNHNKDLFLKRHESFAICPGCSALALAAAQFNATAGGPGFRTSVRGGGPVTTILRGRTLWEDVWLNVVPTQELRDFTPVDPERIAATLPWMGSCRESSKGGVDTPKEEVNVHQVYWSSSKRLQLDEFDHHDPPQPCDVCGDPSSRLVSTYRELRYGTNYVGPWMHPLTPYTLSEKNDPNSLKGTSDGFSYNHWRGIVATHDTANRRPGEVVQYFRKNRESEFVDEFTGVPIRVWAFGYDADNAKIRSWQEGVFPVVAVADEARETFDAVVRQLVEAAEQTASGLRTAIKQALYGRVEITSTGKRKWSYDSTAKVDAALFVQAQGQFWRDTETAFYRTLSQLPQNLNEREVVDDLKRTWLSRLQRAALAIYDATVAYGNFRNADPKTASMARRSLRYAFRHSDDPKHKDGFVAQALELLNRPHPQQGEENE